jgi:hypothetical protein
VVGTQGTLLTSTNLTDWFPLRLPTIKSLFAAQAWEDQLVFGGVEGILLRNRVSAIMTPVDILDYSVTVTTNLVGTGTNSSVAMTAYELLLLRGEPDQQFEFQSCTNLAQGDWTSLTKFELYDPSGTLYVIRSRPNTNSPKSEVYRTKLIP